MTTSQTIGSMSEFDQIPERMLAYIEQRALNHCYAYVMGRFLYATKHHNLTKAKLARRINRGADVVNRWLASPSNWQVGTAARLLAGIASEELKLSSEPFAGRAPRNQTVESLLEEEDDDFQIYPLQLTQSPFPATSTAATVRTLQILDAN